MGNFNRKPKRKSRPVKMKRRKIRSSFGRCIKCGSIRKVRGNAWLHAARPNCYQCGGLLKKCRKPRKSNPTPRRTYQSSARATLSTADWRNYELSFGKFRGKTLGEVPAAYLHWLMTCDTYDLSLLAARRAMVAGGYMRRTDSVMLPEKKKPTSVLQKELNDEFQAAFDIQNIYRDGYEM